MATMDFSHTSTELNDWFGLQSPAFLLTLLFTYLLIVFKIGPAYMKKKKAYELKTFIAIYNLIQVVTCIYIVLQIFNLVSVNVFHFWKCSLYELNSWEEYTYNRLTYFVYWVKVAELSETIVFVLRKKERQVSKLHVFHHCSTLTLFYLLLKYTNGGSSLWALMLNSNVHIVMYLYYLAAAVCDKNVVKRLTPIKKSITTIQMIQFLLILLQAITNWTYCNSPHFILYYYACVVSIMFYGFYDFYRESYTPAHRNYRKHTKSTAK